MAEENEEVTLVSTDEAILNQIGEGDEPTTSDGNEEESSGETTNTSETTPKPDDQQGTDKGGNGKQQEKVAGPQDLVDANGQVIATGGKERRFYETAKREGARADKATKDLELVNAQMKAITDAGTVGTQYGLTPEEVTTGAQLIASYKKNPVETIQYLLTQAQSNGHNIDAIQAGGLDMNAVQLMLDKALAPLVGDRQKELDTQAANDRAQEIYDDFNANHPDGAVHESSISRLMKDNPKLTVEAAYYKLQAYYAQKGLDWTKSLDTLQQEQEAGKSKVNTPSQPPEGNVNAANATDTAQVADVNTSTSDIIKQAMADAGIT